MADDNSARDSSEPAREDAPECLPAELENSVPAGENAGADEDAPVEESFAEDVTGAEDFSHRPVTVAAYINNRERPGPPAPGRPRCLG